MSTTVAGTCTPAPAALFRDACRTMIARCQAAIPTLQEALDELTPATVDAASVTFTDLWSAAQAGDSAVVAMHKEMSDD